MFPALARHVVESPVGRGFLTLLAVAMPNNVRNCPTTSSALLRQALATSAPASTAVVWAGPAVEAA